MKKARDYVAEKLRRNQSCGLREQEAFEREQVEARDRRIEHAARVNPEMSLKELMIRFDCGSTVIKRVLDAAGLRPGSEDWTDEFRRQLSQRMQEKFPEEQKVSWSRRKAG